MQLSPRTLTLSAAAAVILSTTAAQADPTGLWFDHNGRGAVEISPCASGNGLCGYVVHIKEAKNEKRCGMQILGNVTESGGGWIYSPDRGRKYSVALTRLSDSQLRVVGNSGSMFSRTYTWKRAPDDVARCGETTAAAPARPAETAAAPPARVTEAAALPEAAPAPSATRSIGSSSASLALMGAPKRYVTPVAAPAAPEPQVTAAVTEEAAPPKAPAPAKTAAAPVEESFEPAVERKCKFKIPYVGRVISVPCRD